MKYIIRNIAWPHNDSTNQPDGEHSIVETFNSLDEAKERTDYLNYQFFLDAFSYIRRYQPYKDFRTDFSSYNEKIQNHLVEKFGFNESIYLYHHFDQYSIFMFYEQPSQKEALELLKVFDVEFFTINHIDQPNYYSAKITTDFVEHEEELMDYHGMKTLYFKSKRDAYEKFVRDDDYENWFFTLNRSKALNGELTELTSMPRILENLINNSESLEYKDSKLQLKAKIDVETLIQLNELLIRPIFKFRERAISEIEIYPKSDIETKINSNKHDWNTINSRNKKYLNKEDYKFSIDHYLSFVFPLNMDGRFYEYSKIIQEYLVGHFNETEYIHNRYKDRFVTFYGVIISTRKMDEKVIVEATFGVNNKPIISIHKTTFGDGENHQTAFYNCLKSWLPIYGHEIVKEIRN